jgi:hypothetical protein
MGFDLYGLNPKQNTKPPDGLTKFHDEDGWNKWSEMSDEDSKEYFNMKDQHEDENPGNYFRNNVWWWRPLWNYVCVACGDFLTEADQEKGGYNDGRNISATKSKRIASRLRRLLKQGDVQSYADEYTKRLANIKDEECDLCEGTGYRVEPPNSGAGDVDCNGCGQTGKVKPWVANYPFDVGNVECFAEFCEESGGFTIC